VLPSAWVDKESQSQRRKGKLHKGKGRATLLVVVGTSGTVDSLVVVPGLLLLGTCLIARSLLNVGLLLVVVQLLPLRVKELVNLAEAGVGVLRLDALAPFLVEGHVRREDTLGCLGVLLPLPWRLLRLPRPLFLLSNLLIRRV